MSEKKRKCILICINDWMHFTGSEVVALEVAEWFSEANYKVDLFGIHVSAFMRSYIDNKYSITDDHHEVNIDNYDLIWSHHDVVSMFYEQMLDIKSIPLIIYVSLSPFEIIERPDLYVINYLSLPLFVNSIETAKQLENKVKIHTMTIFHNSSPNKFWTYNKSHSSNLKNITIVSNHVPAEILEAVSEWKSLGYNVEHFGMGYNFEKLEPQHLTNADCIITIGKTVQYAIALGKPVYNYDKFGGSGWITTENFWDNASYNFTGRPICRKITHEQIVLEVINGFDYANHCASLNYSLDTTSIFILDKYMESLISVLDDRWSMDNLQEKFKGACADELFTSHCLSYSNQRKINAINYNINIRNRTK